MDISTNLKQVGEVIETLIHIKDSLYSELTFEQKVSLEDACNLLSHHLGISPSMTGSTILKEVEWIL